MSQVGISVDTVNGKIVIAFDQPVDHLILNPTQAGELAGAIVDKAMRLDKKGGSTIVMPPSTGH